MDILTFVVCCFLLFLFSLPVVGIFSKCYYIVASSKRNQKRIVEVIRSYRNAHKNAKKMMKDEGINFYIIFSPFDQISSSLNGNACLYKTIMISASWIEKLSSNNDKWMIAFYHTIGHELGHKMNEPRGSYARTTKARFTNWVREIRADFYGIDFVKRHKIVDNRNAVLETIRMKAKHNTQKKDISDNFHPSWKYRCELLSNNQKFDEKIIKHIANECCFYDLDYIDQMIAYIPK